MTDIEYAKRVIKCISSKVNSFEELFDRLFYKINFPAIEIENNYVPIQINCGMSRCCIIAPTAEHNIVIKFAFRPELNRYNMREAAVFNKIVGTELEQYFAKFYGSFNYCNIDFYVFQNVGNNYGYTTNLFKKKIFPEKLRNFLEENKINDIHSGNYVIINNLPVIFDYAGFDGGL